MSCFKSVLHHSGLFWLAETYVSHTLHLVSMDLTVCPTQTFPHSQSTQSMPVTFRRNLSFTGLFAYGCFSSLRSGWS
jgi:hypothetical protein